MPRNTTKQSKSAETRSRVLRSALSIMAKEGYSNARIRDICADAGVSIGTFYSYFPAKKDIFKDLFDEADDYFVNVVAKNVAGESASEKVLDFFHYYAQLNYDSGISVMRAMYNVENSWFVEFRPMQRVLADIIVEGQRTGEFKSDIPANDISKYLFVVARSCCYGWCLNKGRTDLRAGLDKYIGMAIMSFTA